MEPLIGRNLKQIANQVTWKTPGSDDTTFGFHQDARFRRPAAAFRQLGTSYVQTFVAVDPHTVENGCLKIYPGSHRLGLLDLPADRSTLDMESDNLALKQWGLDPDQMVNIILEPGDVALWLPYTLHGSGPNRSTIDRRSYVNGYVIAENCDRGEWAFRDGEPCELGTPVLIQYRGALLQAGASLHRGTSLSSGYRIKPALKDGATNGGGNGCGARTTCYRSFLAIPSRTGN